MNTQTRHQLHDTRYSSPTAATGRGIPAACRPVSPRQHGHRCTAGTAQQPPSATDTSWVTVAHDLLRSSAHRGHRPRVSGPQAFGRHPRAAARKAPGIRPGIQGTRHTRRASRTRGTRHSTQHMDSAASLHSRHQQATQRTRHTPHPAAAKPQVSAPPPHRKVEAGGG